MAELTLSQAAKRVGRGKSTLHRAIKSGRLSASRADDGTFRIDPSELLRAFPSAVPVRSNGTPRNGAVSAVERSEMAALRSELIAARQAAAVADAERRAAETLADERARALDLAERHIADLRRLLPAPASAPVFRRWWKLWQ